jgi:hypothetical protein
VGCCFGYTAAAAAEECVIGSAMLAHAVLLLLLAAHCCCTDVAQLLTLLIAAWAECRCCCCSVQLCLHLVHQASVQQHCRQKRQRRQQGHRLHTCQNNINAEVDRPKAAIVTPVQSSCSMDCPALVDATAVKQDAHTSAAPHAPKIRC